MIRLSTCLCIVGSLQISFRSVQNPREQTPKAQISKTRDSKPNKKKTHPLQQEP